MASEVVRDNGGRIIGFIDHGIAETVVRDASMRIVGYADQHGTYNADRQRIMNTPIPGMLLGR
jgi:hypothetical protein